LIAYENKITNNSSINRQRNLVILSKPFIFNQRGVCKLKFVQNNIYFHYFRNIVKHVFYDLQHTLVILKYNPIYFIRKKNKVSHIIMFIKFDICNC
jgi:hypothetical protein